MTISLKEIIGQFLNSSDQTSHQFLRLWNIGVFGMKTEFNLDITGGVKTMLLDVNPDKTVTLPCDYIRYSKIGVLNNIGEVVTFKRNNQLTTAQRSISGGLSSYPKAGAINNAASYPYSQLNYNNYFYNGKNYNLFGADSGTVNIGEYKVDDRAMCIFLNMETTYSQIVLEYLSNGFDEGCNDYFIDVRAGECMKSYIRWQEAIDSRKKFSYSTVNEMKKDYYRTKRIAKMRINPFNLSEFNDCIRKSVKLVAKA